MPRLRPSPRPSRLPPPQQNPEEAAALFKRRLGRELGSEFAIDIREAQPETADLIRVVPGGGGRARPPPEDG